jgi:hypothetical protein
VEYENAKRAAGLVDYSDMIALAGQLLRSRPEVLAELVSRIDCLVIDEFQDTNPLQFALLWQLREAASPPWSWRSQAGHHGVPGRGPAAVRGAAAAARGRRETAGEELALAAAPDGFCSASMWSWSPRRRTARWIRWSSCTSRQRPARASTRCVRRRWASGAGTAGGPGSAGRRCPQQAAAPLRGSDVALLARRTPCCRVRRRAARARPRRAAAGGRLVPSRAVQIAAPRSPTSRTPPTGTRRCTWR